MFGFRVLPLAALFVALAAAPSAAQDLAGEDLYLPAVGPEPFISEIRGGIFTHSVDETGPVNIFGVGNFSRVQDVNVELLFTPPDAEFWRIIGNPRPHVGATVNFGGLESMAYAGLTWRLPVFETRIFIEGGLGAALTNGALSGAVYPARNMGCPLQFHEQLTVGYQVTDTFSAMITYEHASHANLCGAVNNRGLSNLGVRVGWTF
jgi:hypothetical protein